MIVRITSRFGDIDAAHKTPHTGIDMAFPEDTPLRSITNGIVEKVVNYGDKNIGQGILIKQDDGKTIIYGHLNQINVQEGEIIHKGDVIGLTGNTGHSTGAHLHLGLKENNTYIDPSNMVNEVAKYAGDLSLWAKFKLNGQIGNVEFPNLWEWAGGKIAKGSINLFVDWLESFIIALPIIAIVGCGVYFLGRMFSHKVGKIGFIGTVIYGGLNV
ncbi:M23 family metallopeptidase [Bacillus litorisediminis]|uniref:M23 family metallopeptidase n=1 Tax=Bacillus litorisediminis TaxID=2922713 RepID=UPI001FAF5407|nr:M23 family metallopeptidase [Bacillus litorisediminis]